ncbi:MAG: tail fiber domain-containing protein, partial [Candidatus Paceibacterota bacterium]
NTGMEIITKWQTSEAPASNPSALWIGHIGHATLQTGRTWKIQTTEQGVNSLGSIALQADGGYVGIAMTNPSVALDVTGDIEYTGTITDVSDQRLKENINIITGTDALNIIKNLQAKSFNMINGTKKEYGFIAQEVLPIFPDSVSIVDPATGYLGISYMSFIPIATEAIKELDLKVTDLSSLDTSVATSLGSLIKNFLADIGNNVTDLYATVIHSDKVETKEIEMKDTATGEYYCVVITNGEFNKMKGKCGEEVVATPTPTVTPTSSPEPTPTPTPTTDPTLEITPTPEATPTPTPTPDPTPTPTPDPTPDLTPSPTPEATPTPTP